MTRVISGAVMVIVAVVVVWFAPPWAFLVAAQALVVLAVSEYMTLAPRARVLPMPLVAAATVGCSLALVASGSGPGLVVIGLLAAVVGLGTVAMLRWDGGAEALATVASAVFPVLYLGLPVAALVVVRERQGAAGLFLLMLTVMISDTAQYYAGRGFGRRPLAPRISPKKTIEGAIGGFVVGPVAFAWISQRWLAESWLSWPAGLALGAAIVAAGIAGDLFESMLKRSAGVKDSSALIPGHGGVLDRVDALLFAAPVYFAALTYL
jgi:phosphatidate cytidylyltransferase